MMDKSSLRNVLAGVAYILEGKAAHLAENWQDYTGQRMFERAAGAIWKLIEKPVIRIYQE
jgi:hypothetical protein